MPAATASSGTTSARCGRRARPHSKFASKRRPASRRRSISPTSRSSFIDEPGVKRIVWLFSMVLGYSAATSGAATSFIRTSQSVLRCHIAAFEAIGGAPREILYDRMKTAVIGEDAEGLVVYNRALDRPRPPLWLPAARLPPLPGQDEGKSRAAVPLHPRGFFPRRRFRNLDDLNEQLRHWLDAVANPRMHATTQRVVNEAFSEEKPSLKQLPAGPLSDGAQFERRVSHDGMVSVGGNFYSVPDTTRRRVLDVHVFADAIRIFEDGALIASHPPLEGRGQKRLDPTHRKIAPPSCRRPAEGQPIVLLRAGEQVARRPLAFYEAVGRRLASQGGSR